MYAIESVSITDFWGDKNLEMQFDPNVNFIVGPNGSGKTTFINMLSSALSGDVFSLHEAPFSRIIIRLARPQTKTRSSIEIVKSDAADSESKGIVFEIRTGSKARKSVFSYPSLAPNFSPRYISQVRRHRAFQTEEILLVLRELVNLSWLSVHRSPLISSRDDDPESMSPVDRKVAEISRTFSNFLSLLGAKASEEQNRFLETVFLSLLYDPDRNVDQVTFTQRDEDKAELSKIFTNFGLRKTAFEQRLNRHFQEISRKLEPTQRASPAFRPSDLAVLTDTVRLHELVIRWKEFQEKQEQIYSPRSNFLKIINSMLVRKTMNFTNRNIPVIKTQSGKEFEPQHLSSGEKQLYIFLGEAVLQESKPCVFLADEPELSMHILWQSQLVQSLHELNQNSQIIFATHSPDIVGRFSSKVIEIENLIV